MKVGGQIPWKAFPICEMFKISYLMTPWRGKGGGGRGRSPTRAADKVTGGAEGAAIGGGGPPKDSTRVFPVKGAADALCDPWADVPRGVASRAAQSARLRRNPSDDFSQGRGPPSPAGLQDQRVEGGAQGGHLGGGVQEGIFAGFNFMEHIRHRRRGGEGSGAEEGRNGEVPGLSEPGRPAGDPHVGRAAAPTRRGKRGEPSVSEKVPPGSGRRPGFSSSGETEVYSATAEQTMLRTALGGAAWKCGREERGKKLKSTTKEGCIWATELKDLFEPLTKLVKEVLGDNVKKVIVSRRIVDSLCVLTTSEYGWFANMERIMKARALRDNSMTSHMASNKTMEVNPTHSITKELKQEASADLLSSGFNLDEPTQFAGRIHRMIELGLSIDDDDDLPPLVKVERAADEYSKMEEVD